MPILAALFPISNAINSEADLKMLNAPTQFININKLIGECYGILVPHSDGMICFKDIHLEHLGCNIDQSIDLESISTGYF